MFNNITAGSLSVRIIVEAPNATEDGAGREVNSWQNVFGEGKSIPAKWRRKLSKFDTSVDDAKSGRVFALETSTVTVRYTKAITSSCRVRLKGEKQWYYIIGTPNRSPEGNWLEFTAERRGAL